MGRRASHSKRGIHVQKISEVDIEKATVQYAEALGMIAMKINVPGRKGFPDHLFLAQGGRPLFIEFKAPGKKPREIQMLRLKQLVNQGVPATWIDNLEDGKRAINSHQVLSRMV